MKKLFFLWTFSAFLFAFIQRVSGQYSLSWQNSQQTTKGIGALASDNQGNTIATGTFKNSISFGNITLTQSLHSAAYIAKMNASGGWTWAKKINIVSTNAQSIASAVIKDVVSDNNGNIYITGYFNGTIGFDNISLTESYNSKNKNIFMFTSSDIFVAKLNSAGTFLWAKREGDVYLDLANGIALDAQGNPYITGEYARVVNSVTLHDLYVARYSSSGTKQWEKRFTTNNASNTWFRGNDIALDAANNIYVTGHYLGTANFSSNISFTSATTCTYLAKLSSANGDVAWAKTAAGNWNSGESVLVDNANNVYVSGRYGYAAVSFDNLSVPAPTSSVNSNDTQNSFLVKYSSSGVALWAVKAINTDQNNFLWGRNQLFNYPGGNIGLYSDAINGIHLKHFDPATGAEAGAAISSGFHWDDYFNGTSEILLGGITSTANDLSFSLMATGVMGFGNLTIVSSQSGINKSDLFVLKYAASSSNAGTVAGPASLCIGQTSTFTSDGDPGGTWSSSNTSVATIDANSGAVNAVAPGTANIVYSVGGASASKTVNVDGDANSGTISGATSVCAGAKALFTSNGTIHGTWSSDNTAVATVNGSGEVTGVSAGTANIIYTVNNSCGTVSSSKSILVTNPPVSLTCPPSVVFNLSGKDKNKCYYGYTPPAPEYSNNCVVKSLTWTMTGATNDASPTDDWIYYAAGRFQLGVTTVTYKLTNGGGSIGTCSFTVRVNNPNCSAARTPVTEANVLMENTDAVILYPNPASGNTVTIRNTKALGTVRIYDISGKLIYNRFIGDPQAVIDVQKFAPGIYYLKTEAGRPVTFIKQ